MLILGDCLEESKKIESGSVDLILTDLPFGTMKGIDKSGEYSNKSHDWDVTINTDDFMQVANRILRKNGKMILFAQQPFTTELITKAIPNLPFNYTMIWEKDNFANALSCNVAPVNYTEDILVFSKKHDHEELHPLRVYFKSIMDFIGLNKKGINNKLGHQKAEHTFRFNSTQFALCTEKTYKELIDIFNIDKCLLFMPFDKLEEINSTFNSTFNLWEGGKYKSNIFKYKKDYTGHHPTQKPILLLEDLIKTYSNKGDLVVDLTMGSGSTGVACKNSERKFIGIEKNSDFFNVAKKRIQNV